MKLYFLLLFIFFIFDLFYQTLPVGTEYTGLGFEASSMHSTFFSFIFNAFAKSVLLISVQKEEYFVNK